MFPQDATLITRESYEKHEAYGSLGSEDTDEYEVAVEAEDEEEDSDWDRKYAARKRSLRSNARRSKKCCR